MNAHVAPPSEFDIRDAVVRQFDVSPDDMVGPLQRGPLCAARNELAYRLWTERREMSLRDVARLIGRRDHGSAIHCILAGARARGLMVARVSDLREAVGDKLDWTKLAYAVAGWRERHGLPLEKAARRAGVSRSEWRKCEQGRAVSAGTMLRLCLAAEVDPMTLIDAVTHETPVKHERRR